MPARGLGLGARPGINGLLGFQGWLGILPSAHTLKVVNNEASEGESVKEVVAKDFERFPLFFGLHVSGDFVNQVPEKENKSNGNCFVFTCLGGSGEIYYLGFESKTAGPYCVMLSGANLWPRHLGNWLVKARGGLGFLCLAPQTHNQD